MKKGDVPAALSLIIVFLIALFATVVVLSISGKGVPEGGTQAGGSAASMSGSGTEIGCSTFCGSNYLGKLPLEQAKGKCMVVRCSSKSYSYGCEYDTTYTPECKATCIAAYPACTAECGNPPNSAPPPSIGASAHYLSDNCANVLKDTTAATPPPASGDKLVLEKLDGTEITQVILGEQLKVKKKPSSGPKTDVAVSYFLQQAGVDVLATACKTEKPPIAANCVKCGSTPADCAPANYNPFIVPAAGMPDGAYTLLITEPDTDPTKPPKTSGAWTFSWTCPAVKIEDKPYNAGKKMTAVFESKIDAVSDVTIKLNGGTVTKYPLSVTPPNKISFDIPKLGASGSSLIEGNNELVVKREGKGLCLKAGKVENGITETFNWVCPANGCYQKAGKWYVVSGKGTTSSACASPGSCQDVSTGCWYDKTEGAECKHGCMDGACKLPDLKIVWVNLTDSTVLPGIPLGEQIQDHPSGGLLDRILAVEVENAGTSKAYDIAATAKYGTEDLSLMLVEPPAAENEIAPLGRGKFKFLFPPKSITKGYVEYTVKVAVQGADTDGGPKLVEANSADNNFEKTVKVYKEYCCISAGEDPCKTVKPPTDPFCKNT